MKVAIRAFAVCVVLAGGVAVTLSPASKQVVASPQSATARLPIPVCGPSVPTCGPKAAPSIR